jgi:hypothetical protein
MPGSTCPSRGQWAHDLLHRRLTGYEGCALEGPKVEDVPSAEACRSIPLIAREVEVLTADVNVPETWSDPVKVDRRVRRN